VKCVAMYCSVLQGHTSDTSRSFLGEAYDAVCCSLLHHHALYICYIHIHVQNVSCCREENIQEYIHVHRRKEYIRKYIRIYIYIHLCMEEYV